MVAAFGLLTKFSQRALEVIFFKVIENSFGRISVQKSQNFRDASSTIGNHMRVVTHNDIRDDHNAAGRSGFIPCVADDLFNFVGLKNWQAVFCNRSQIVAGIAARYSHYQSHAAA